MPPTPHTPERTSREDFARRLYNQFAPDLLRLIQRRLHPILRARLDAEDIMQSVWLQFFSRVQPTAVFDGDEHLRSFLFSMVVLRVREIHRDNLSTRKRSIYLDQAPDAGKAVSA